MSTLSRTVNPDLPARIAKMIEAFEGGWLAGNFDGQIISWGPFQWNLGQGTLQPLMKRIVALDPLTVQRHLGADIMPAIKTDHLVQFAKQQILTPSGNARTDWQKRFARLAQEPVTQRVFAEFMTPYLRAGERVCTELDFHTERAYALGVDVAVQNGGPRKDHFDLYRQRLGDGSEFPDEWMRLKLFAAAVADRALARWRDDVYARKSTIALGRGTVHKRAYVMHEDFGIRYWADANARVIAPWYVPTPTE